MLLSRRNQLLLEFSFWNEPVPREGPNIYELRSYQLRVSHMSRMSRYTMPVFCLLVFCEFHKNEYNIILYHHTTVCQQCLCFAKLFLPLREQHDFVSLAKWRKHSPCSTHLFHVAKMGFASHPVQAVHLPFSMPVCVLKKPTNLFKTSGPF